MSEYCRILFEDNLEPMKRRWQSLGERVAWYFNKGGIKHAIFNIPDNYVEHPDQWDAAGITLYAPPINGHQRLLLDIPHAIYKAFVELLASIDAR